MKKGRLLALVLLLLSFAGRSVNSFSAQYTSRYYVVGRVVGENGQPASDVTVHLLTPPCNCIDNVTIGYTTGTDGVFFLDVLNPRLRTARVLAEEKVPKGFWLPISFPALSRLNRFKGINIQLPKRNNKELGDIPVHIQYGKVSLRLSDVLDDPDSYTTGLSGQMQITLRDDRRRKLNHIVVSARAFDKAFSMINLALPKGKWFIDFTIVKDRKKSPARRFLIEVKGLDKVRIQRV